MGLNVCAYIVRVLSDTWVVGHSSKFKVQFVGTHEGR